LPLSRAITASLLSIFFWMYSGVRLAIPFLIKGGLFYSIANNLRILEMFFFSYNNWNTHFLRWICWLKMWVIVLKKRICYSSQRYKINNKILTVTNYVWFCAIIEYRWYALVNDERL
jgi:hypothetical protein